MNFFDHHWAITAVFLVFFPRLTLLFGSFSFGGLFWWLGWIFVPHTLIAILAIPYFDKNPVLTVIAWVLAIYELSDFFIYDTKKKK